MSDASLSTLESIYDELVEVSRMCEELLTRTRMLSEWITEINPGDYINGAAEFDSWLPSLEEHYKKTR